MYPLFKLHYYVTILCYVHLIYIHTILHSWKHPENLVQCHPLEVDVQGQQKPCCSPAVTCLLQPTFPPLQTGRVLPWTSIRLRQENSSQAVMMRRSCFGLLFLEAGGGVLEMEGSKPPVDAGVWLEFMDDCWWWWRIRKRRRRSIVRLLRDK